ncbi:hypothetical protein [Shewanella marina]|uniref:hypothetical protein n=1 Tax=Shewanella marina TaxID=487319 RepID=UPI00046F2339|nr:hypothetical protein [Shewanella marina]
MLINNEYCQSAPWLLIGNGPTTDSVYGLLSQSKFNTVVFNHGYNDLTSASRIYNAMLANADLPKCISGILATELFAAQLIQSHALLCHDLGQVASVGLTTMHALTQISEADICVMGMTLLPSIVIPDNCSSKRAIPSQYHNWLGERHIALQLRKRYSIAWPDLTLKSAPTGREWIANPDYLLLQLQQRPADLEAINQLSQISVECWSSHLTRDSLQELEPLFHLNRKQHYSKNWWLFDYNASGAIATIHYTLAWCQQVLFSNS